MKINIEFKNYKLLKNKKAVLDGCNVYLVQGANEQGKTSFINGLLTMLQAENKTKQPVTLGEKNGQISLDMKTDDGKDFKMLFEFTDQKNKFTLISDNKLLSKVTDIRSFLNYQTITADEFISWSNTAEGRRKQRDIVLDLLGADIKQKFIELTAKEKELYEERTLINSELKALKMLCAESPIMTDEEKKDIKKIEDYKASLLIEEKNIQEAANKLGIMKSLNHEISSIINTCDRLEPYGDLINIDKIKAIKTLATDSEIDILKYEPNCDAYQNLSTKIQHLTILRDKQRLYNEHAGKLIRNEGMAEELNNKIIKLRQEKINLTSNANLPIDDIAIDDDGIWIKTQDGLLPFDINQVSTSRIMLIVAKIILMLNKQLPIVIMGRGEAFDTTKLNELSKFAEANNCLLIIDKVTDSQGIEIVGYEDVN